MFDSTKSTFSFSGTAVTKDTQHTQAKQRSASAVPATRTTAHKSWQFLGSHRASGVPGSPKKKPSVDRTWGCAYRDGSQSNLRSYNTNVRAVKRETLTSSREGAKVFGAGRFAESCCSADDIVV